MLSDTTAFCGALKATVLWSAQTNSLSVIYANIVFDRRIVDAWDTVLGMWRSASSTPPSMRQLETRFSVGRDLDRQLLPSAVPADTKQYMDTLIPNNKRRREVVHQHISIFRILRACRPKW
jgi:hypothetical protein